MITQIEHGFELSHNNNLILRHTTMNPAFFIGTKDLSIQMNKGEFDIDDQTSYIPERALEITSSSITFSHFKMTLSVKDQRLHLLFHDLTEPLRIRLLATPEESIHGMGEHFTAFNLRGHIVKNWVEEHITRPQIYNKIIRRLLKLPPKKWSFEQYKTYMIVPSFVSSNSYFCDCNLDGYGTFDFTHNDYHQLSFVTPLSGMTFSFRPSLMNVCADLAQFKGITPPLPDWTYDGMILGIQGGTEVIQKELTKLLDEDTKITAIWAQDWCGELFTYFGKQVLWNWTVDTTLYPELATTIKKWNMQHIHFLGYVNPYLNQNEGFFQEALKQDYLVKNADGSPFLTQATSFQFGIIDFTNSAAYEWFKQLIKTEMIDLGMSGWMADFGEYLPTDCVLYQGNGEEYHNQWPDLWTKLNRELLEEQGKMKEVLFFNRAGYKNNMKYTTLIWNGDQHVDFTTDFGMRSVVRAMLGLSMSGFGLSHSDIGGYTTVPGIKRSKNLYVRWLEMNAFTPVMRSHEGNRPWANAQPYSDEETIAYTARFSRVHAALKPYLKAVETDYQNTGTPMIRPLLWYTDNLRDDCFLIGDDLIVFPVLHTRKKMQSVDLPEGFWIHVFTSQQFPSGNHKIASPLGCPPVFYRAESPFEGVFKTLKNI